MVLNMPTRNRPAAPHTAAMNAGSTQANSPDGRGGHPRQELIHPVSKNTINVRAVLSSATRRETTVDSRRRLNQCAPDSPLIQLEKGLIGKTWNGTQAQDGHGLGIDRNGPKVCEEIGINARNAAHAKAFCPRGHPQVLDGTRHRCEVHVRHGASTENVMLTVIRQRDHQQLSAIEDALDLERDEFVSPLPERFGRLSSFTGHERVCRNDSSVIRVNRDGANVMPTTANTRQRQIQARVVGRACEWAAQLGNSRLGTLERVSFLTALTTAAPVTAPRTRTRVASRTASKSTSPLRCRNHLSERTLHGWVRVIF